MSKIKIKYVFDLVNGKQSTMVLERVKHGGFNYGNNTAVAVTMYDTNGKYCHDWIVDTRYTAGMDDDEKAREWINNYVLDYYKDNYISYHVYNCSPSDEP